MKSNTIIYLIIFILLIIIVWRYYKSTQSTAGNLSNAQSTFSSLISTFAPHPTLTSTTPTTANNAVFKFGDLIYAKSNTTNAYKVPVISVANLDSYKAFNANDLIGTFLSYDGIFVKINATNPARIVYVLSSQVYTK